MAKTNAKMSKERKEAWLRIPIGLLSIIILSVWKVLVIILSVFNWFYTLITGSRNKECSEFSEYWNTEMYKLMRYLTFVSNSRPFPFSTLDRMSKFEK